MTALLLQFRKIVLRAYKFLRHMSCPNASDSLALLSAPTAIFFPIIVVVGALDRALLTVDEWSDNLSCQTGAFQMLIPYRKAGWPARVAHPRRRLIFPTAPPPPPPPPYGKYRSPVGAFSARRSVVRRRLMLIIIPGNG